MAGKNSGIIGFRVERAVYRFLVEPEIDPTAGIGAFLEHRPSDFAGLARYPHSAIPLKGHVYVKQYARRQPLPQDKIRKLPRKLSRMAIGKATAAVSQ